MDERELPPEFKAALSTLEPGALAPQPVVTRFGVHVLQLIERRSGPTSQLDDETRTRLRVFLRDTSWKQNVQDYIARLGTHAKIKNFDLFAGTTVQTALGQTAPGQTVPGQTRADKEASCPTPPRKN